MLITVCRPAGKNFCPDPTSAGSIWNLRLLGFDMVWRLNIFDLDIIMLSYDNSIFNISASIFLILVFRYRV